jgi:hypothetical protein
VLHTGSWQLVTAAWKSQLGTTSGILADATQRLSEFPSINPLQIRWPQSLLLVYSSLENPKGLVCLHGLAEKEPITADAAVGAARCNPIHQLQ